MVVALNGQPLHDPMRNHMNPSMTSLRLGIHRAAEADDLPPGLAPASGGGEAKAQPAPAPAHAAAPPAAGKAPAKPQAAATGSDEWKFDPNSGLFYQLSSSAYYDSKSRKYFKDGKWTDSL